VRKSFRSLFAAVAVLAAGMGVSSETAAAATLSCGQVVTQSVTLTADVGPCPNNGIVAGANHIVIDLNGFRVFGTANVNDGAGVLVSGRQGVTVQRGTITNFDAGVAILGGSGNTVTQITARDNIGLSRGVFSPVTLYGEGILVQGSSGNTVTSNVAVNNGPYGGISLIPGDPDHPAIPPALTNNNLVQGNIVRDNVACRIGLTSNFCDSDGIRIEPGAGSNCLVPATCPGPGNRIIGNTVTGSPLDGIALFGSTTGNLVAGNSVSGNGFTGAAAGDGIRVFGYGNTIQSNTVTGNRAGGISVGRRPPSGAALPGLNGKNNQLLSNIARSNGLVDLWDSNPNCDNNVWRQNFGVVATPACTRF
jgi:parallel beta-helix repeat protein